MKRILLAVAIFFQSVFSGHAASPFEKWEPDIKAFEAADRTNPPPKNAILFAGASSIRLWTNLAQAFPDQKVFRRGFGGSTMADLLHFAERIVLPNQPRQVLVYEGDNDIASGRKPEEIIADFKAFCAKIHQSLPETKIWFISIKPSPSRWALQEKIRRANDGIHLFCKGNPKLGYIDIWNPMLGPDGKPMEDIFVADKLHMNAKGYAIWTKAIEKKL